MIKYGYHKAPKGKLIVIFIDTSTGALLNKDFEYFLESENPENSSYIVNSIEEAVNVISTCSRSQTEVYVYDENGNIVHEQYLEFPETEEELGQKFLRERKLNRH